MYKLPDDVMDHASRSRVPLLGDATWRAPGGYSILHCFCPSSQLRLGTKMMDFTLYNLRKFFPNYEYVIAGRDSNAQYIAFNYVTTTFPQTSSTRVSGSHRIPRPRRHEMPPSSQVSRQMRHQMPLSDAVPQSEQDL